jgi:hypothetical protein
MLDDDARMRMRTFEEFVRSDLSRRVADLRSNLARHTSAIPDSSSTRGRVTAFLNGAPENVKAVEARALDGLAARERFARSLATGADEGDAPSRLENTEPIAQYIIQQTSVADAQAALRNEHEQRRIIARRAELRGRIALSAALPEVRTYIDARRQVARLEDAKRAGDPEDQQPTAQASAGRHY